MIKPSVSTLRRRSSALLFVLGLACTASTACTAGRPFAAPAGVADGPRADEPAARFEAGPAARLDHLLTPIREKHGVPALAAAIVTADGISAAGAVGRRRADADTGVRLGDRFHIGSCTKAMTAALAAILVERGMLRWDSTLAEVFPERAAQMHADYRGATLEQLLSHVAGIPQDLSADGLWAQLWTHRGTPLEQRLALLDGVTRRPPLSRPGTAYLYSNAGVSVAGAMLERVSGEAWEALIERELFKPLGMSSAGFGAPGRPEDSDQPRGHRRDGDRLVPVEPGRGSDNPDAIAPAGKVHCSVTDWGRFVGLNLYGPRGRSALMGSEAFAKLHTPAPGRDYALGWAVTRRDWGGTVLTHAGSNTLWFAVTWVAPQRGFGVVVATNVAGEEAQRACDEAAWALIQWHLGR
ncbi:MAG: beta-lactamase family protein [Phycisphaerae bacterium]|nr:beta-lactamase family protein [Phycisphaerae bacterium]MCZ2398659.1 beta-lactamase family protein [Phycisphaerae bacterium]